MKPADGKTKIYIDSNFNCSIKNTKLKLMIMFKSQSTQLHLQNFIS